MKLLVVDDDEVTRKLLKEVLEPQGYDVTLANSGEAALRALKTDNYPVILSDIRMLELDGMAVLREAKKQVARPSVILMTGFGSMEGAVEAIQEGAFDYVSKPFKMDDLRSVVARAVKDFESRNPKQRKSLALTVGRMDVASKGLIGKSPRIVEVYKTLARAALSESSVLITGESGTGKELVARAVHENGARKLKKFVAVNCGALSENLLESELFGHSKGSFTGAISDKRGLFEEATGGTLFLDEIGDISQALQIKLLRVLQESEVRPVGSNDSKKVDTRIIVATHRNLESLVEQGKFREDLFYRLKVIHIELPPLRERMEDLPELIEHFVSQFAAKNKKPISHVSEEALQLLSEYSWPGNIRELEHAIERAVAMTNATILFPEDFPPEISRKESAGQLRSESTDETDGSSLEDMERVHILRVLQEVKFNKSKAAELLGIDRATLYRKLQRYGLEGKK